MVLMLTSSSTKNCVAVSTNIVFWGKTGLRSSRELVLNTRIEKWRFSELLRGSCELTRCLPRKHEDLTVNEVQEEHKRGTVPLFPFADTTPITGQTSNCHKIKKLKIPEKKNPPRPSASPPCKNHAHQRRRSNFIFYFYETSGRKPIDFDLYDDLPRKKHKATRITSRGLHLQRDPGLPSNDYSIPDAYRVYGIIAGLPASLLSWSPNNAYQRRHSSCG